MGASSSADSLPPEQLVRVVSRVAQATAAQASQLVAGRPAAHATDDGGSPPSERDVVETVFEAVASDPVWRAALLNYIDSHCEAFTSDDDNAHELATIHARYTQLYEQLQFLANLTSEQPAAGTPLRRLVEQAIRAGSHNLAAVAETLQVPPRTLQRRLRTEGTTFRMVLNEVRVDLARQLLQDASLPIPEIAQRLHYSDDKSFRKAFKAVTGLSPTAFRGGAQGQPDVDG